MPLQRGKERARMREKRERRGGQRKGSKRMFGDVIDIDLLCTKKISGEKIVAEKHILFLFS